ncbi:MAG: hypothetical protein ABI777_02390 [Betaproteobacteria bacterium]
MRRGRWRGLTVAMTIWSATVVAGPVDLYLTGPEFCPRDRPVNAPRINAGEAIARTRTMVPRDFCGPSMLISGCTYDVENEYDSWRVYVHQYKERGGRQDKGGLLHTYLILDAVGNCLAHIPGTEFGANN